MTEEKVTKRIIKWLIHNKWEIVCFDFPQSGTGVFLHPKGANSKNKDSINPDIVAVKNDICVFFENKPYFYYKDFEKVSYLKNTDVYCDDIEKLLGNRFISFIYYGIGMPNNSYKEKAKQSKYMTDFIVGVSEETADILYDPNSLFV